MTKMVKCACLWAALLISCAHLFASGGVMAGQGKVRCYKTKYFDIIYGESSIETAAALAQNADSIADEVCKKLGVAMYFRMPVVITAAVEQYNAYFTILPFNHIVLYDTLPQEDFALFSHDMLDTFRHEFTHAMTYNNKSRFWKTFDMIMGDVYNWGMLVSTTSFVAEGAAVALESRDGNGRMYDSWFLHTIRQAKLQGTFPNGPDVSGARDIYPYDVAYRYGGPFTAWLLKTYPQSTYNYFWYRAVNGDNATPQGAFKDAYGITLNQAWQDFTDSISVPDIPSHPLNDSAVSDVFTPKATTFSKQNSKGARYDLLTVSKAGIAYLDASCGAIYFAAKKQGEQGFDAPHRLCTFRKGAVSRLQLSTDGTLLAVSVYDTKHLNVKQQVLIYSLIGKKWYKLPDIGLRDATIITHDGKYTLAAVKTQSNHAALQLYHITVNDRHQVRDVQLYKTLPAIDAQQDSLFYSPCDTGTGFLALIRKNGLTWSLASFSINDMHIMQEYALPDGMRIRSLAPEFDSTGRVTGSVSFSWTQYDTFPRYGSYALATNTLTLQSRDISGGVYHPVVYGDTAWYSGFFIDDLKLLSLHLPTLTIQTLSLEEPSSVAIVPPTSTEAASSFVPDSAVRTLLAQSKDYYSPYHLKGSLLPGAVPVYTTGAKLDTSLFAAQYLMTNTWSTDVLGVNVGWDSKKNYVGSTLSFTNNPNTSLVQYSIEPTVIWKEGEFFQATGVSTLASGIPVGLHSTVTLSNTNVSFVGTDEKAVTDFFTEKNDSGITLSTVHACGSGMYESGGISLGAMYQVRYSSLYDDITDGEWYYNPYPVVGLRLPKLLPITCVPGHTYNLPFRFTVKLYPDAETFFEGSGTVILYAQEIQRGLTVFPAYFHRVVASLSYTGYFEQDNESMQIRHTIEDCKDMDTMPYRDKAELTLLLGATLNTGYPSSLVFYNGLSFGYRFNRDSDTDAFYVKATSTLKL